MHAAAIIGTLLIAAGTAGAGPVPAFPGAEGAGALTPGGRGGRVIAVTNLNAAGEGSFAWACRQAGPRIVVFRVSGNIDLDTLLLIREPYLTIAGQTAPGDGVCIRNFGLIVERTHDIVVRHLRVRPGDRSRTEQDALWVHASHDVIIDHCSTSWGTDETLSVTGGGSTNVTVQWCMIAESLNKSVHHKGPHGYGSLLRTDGVLSFHHNLYAHHSSRNPRPGCDGDGLRGSLLDFRNNVVYDWGERPGYSMTDKAAVNLVGNYYRPGPSTQQAVKKLAFIIGGASTNLYASANVHEGNPDAAGDNWSLISIERQAWTDGARLPAALSVPPVATEPAPGAFERVVREAGATRPVRDTADRRIAADVGNSTGRIIDSQSDVGGWPALSGGNPGDDTDGDGMPDGWEVSRGFDPHDAADGPADANHDGYTNVEEFLNATDPHQSETGGAGDWAEKIGSSFLQTHPGAVTWDSLSPSRKWNYEQGFMLRALWELGGVTGDPKYREFVRQNLDRFVKDDGTIETYAMTDYNLDNISPGRMLLALFRTTGEEKYRRAADLLHRQLEGQPRTSEGGYWHKKIYPNQMWLDGLFMAGPFAAAYAVERGDTTALDNIIDQFVLVGRHTSDSVTGLHVHGWDESRKERWADPATGRSPSFWARSMGWYMMGLVDVLDILPSGHRRRGELLGIFRRLAAALLPYRDAGTHLWYQVVDQGSRQGNYLESSASAMFAYAYARGAGRGYLDRTYRAEAESTFAGLVRHMVTVHDDGTIDLRGTCRSAGLGGTPYRDGSFEYYVAEPQRLNDMKGLAPLLLAAIELGKDSTP
jgi:rhamnogalacturonyl hydrolase YesR